MKNFMLFSVDQIFDLWYEFLIYLQESSVTKILNLDAGVTQISLSSIETDLQTKLIVSTETRTIVCDTMKQSFVEIGNQPR